MSVLPSFIHLRVSTAYSLLKSAIPVKKLAGLCKAQSMPAVGVTDYNNLFGSLEISESLFSEGIQPIIGSTLDVMLPQPEKEGFRVTKATQNGDDKIIAPLVFLVQNETGYLNLLHLQDLAYARAMESHLAVTLDELSTATEGLIVLTGGTQGLLGHLVSHNYIEQADSLLTTLKSLYPNQLYIEIQRLDVPNEIKVEEYVVAKAYEMDLPLVATNEVVFPKPDMYKAHDALLCIAGGRYVTEEDRPKASPHQWFKSAEEMEKLFKDLPEACQNTVEIAQRCAYRVKKNPPMLPRFVSEEGLDEAEELRRQARVGLAKRLEENPLFATKEEYEQRLEFELDVIIGMQFPGYFLIVADFIQWAKGKNIPVGPGRGSGAGSVVAWSLTITDLDPLRFGLLFERFLNPERVSMPDFDIDFCQDRRDEVIHYVQNKYGKNQVAQIITFGKLQARAVIRDVGRVLQMPYGQVDRLCKLIPNNPAKPTTIPEALKTEERFKEAYETEEGVKELIDIALQLEGLYRHASTHAAGVVIGDRPLSNLIPVYRDPRSEMLVTQFNMKWVEPAGLVKFDFLGLKTLTVLQKSVEFIEKTGEYISLSNLPLDDQKTYSMLGRGDGTAVFQLESSGMRDVLRRMKPDCIEDIIAIVSLYRPGPMDSIPQYIACKKGEEEPDYLHPWLEDILKETKGIIIYQEQVMQIAQTLAGYSLGEADLLRRAMGKKIKEEMDQQKARFMQGALEKGVETARADFIFELVAKFAGYGFNKCISGTEKFYRIGQNENGKSSFHPTIEAMYKIKHDKNYARSINKISLHKAYKTRGYGYSFSLNDDNRLVKNKIIDIRSEGVQKVYCLVLKNGKTIKTTGNHKFPTSNGMKMLQDIDIHSDLIFFNEGYEPSDTMYRFTQSNNQNYHSDDFLYPNTGNSEKGKMGFQRKDGAFSQLRIFIQNHKKTACQLCNDSLSRLEIHHIDGNHGNNDFSNLMTVCSSCHKKEHYKLGRIKQGQKGLLTSLIEIESIEYVGEEDVYDVEMEAPFHTFTTHQGIVTCNSHAAAYALLAYQTAYMKANYPTQFMAAMMTLDMAHTEKMAGFKQELDRLHLSLKPPCVNHSQSAFSVEGDSIRYALAAIKNVGEGAMETLVQERQKNGLFKSPFDLVRRVDSKTLNKRNLENLIKAGALDCFSIPRHKLLAGVDLLVSQIGGNASQTEQQQVSLFGDIEEEQADPVLPDATEWTPIEQLNHEFSALGFYLSAHPLDSFRTVLKRNQVMTYAELEHKTGQTRTARGNIAGVVIAKQEKKSSKGSRFAFVHLSDWTGSYEIMIFSEMLAQWRDKLTVGTPLVLSVENELEEERSRMRVRSIKSIHDLPPVENVQLKLGIDSPNAFQPLAELCEMRGESPVFVQIRCEETGKVIDLKLGVKVALTSSLLMSLQAISGIHSIEEI